MPFPRRALQRRLRDRVPGRPGRNGARGAPLRSHARGGRRVDSRRRRPRARRV